jgi:hypothetical protein
MTEEIQKFQFELIDFDDWDAAKWKATAFASPVGAMLPPWLIILFANEQPARAAFAALRSKVGREDEEDLIRVSVVEGTFGANPDSYAVKIGPEVRNVMRHFQLELGEGEFVPFSGAEPL